MPKENSAVRRPLSSLSSKAELQSTMKHKIRKSTRLKEYDYSNNGVYFVTICVKDRKPVLCKIVGEGLCALPKIEYTEIGAHVKNSIEYIDINNPNIYIDNYVIMPNHIHLLIRIENSLGGHRNPPLQDIIAKFKSYTTHLYKQPLWQRSFYDHIIRNESDYLEHWTYIENNLIRWELDELHCDML